VFIGNADTLSGVDLLNLLEHVDFDFFDVGDFKERFRIDRAFGDLAAIIDLIALLHAKTSAKAGGVRLGFKGIRDRNFVAAAEIFDIADFASDLADDGFAFRVAGFDELLDTGKTLSNIGSCNTAGVEDTHG